MLNFNMIYMGLLRKKVTFFVTLFFVFNLYYGTDVIATPSPQWQQIQTPHYRILFLSPMGQEAQRLANITERLYTPINQAFSQKPHSIPLILRSTTACTGGKTEAMPTRKVTFFTFPPQNYNFIYHIDWLTYLAIHELRHVSQHQIMINNGGLSYLIPDWQWFAEGDAVTTETVLSTAGRGRIPYFEAIYKVNLLTYGDFSYFKQLYGSYHHHIPDHYKLGYVMITYLQRHYGIQVVDRLLERNNLVEKINPWALHLQCKKITGKSIGEIYLDANHERKNLWTQQLEGLPITPFALLHPHGANTYAHYAYPQAAGSRTIALKHGPGNIPKFVSIDASGKEHTIVTPGPIDETIRFSVAKDRLAWIEHRGSWDPENNRYTTIQTYDLAKKFSRTLASPSRYSTVMLSPNGNQMVAMETDEAYQHRIVILDAQTGKRLWAIPNTGNHYYLTPTWSPDGQCIVAIKHVNNTASIVAINLKTGISEELLPPTKTLIGCPVMNGQYIYYNSAYSGIDNIYALHLKTKKIFQVTSSQYGAYNPAISIDGKWVLYNDLGKQGMSAVKTLINPIAWIPLTQVEDRNIRYYQPLIDEQKIDPLPTVDLPEITYPIQPYTHWDNIKSSSCSFSDLPTSFNGLYAGGIKFQDLLEKYTFILPAFEYEWQSFYKHTGHLFSKFTYHNDYAIAEAQARFSSTYNLEKEDISYSIKQSYTAKLSIPLKFYLRHYIITTKFSTEAALNHNMTFKNDWGRSQSYTVSYSSYVPKSSRDFYTPWLQSLSVSFMHTPYGGNQTHRLTNRLKLHFPGLFKHHTLRTSVLTQHFNDQSKLEPIAHRGLTQKENQLAHHRFRISYDFPIAYPDLSITPFLFIKRLSANLFYSYAFHHCHEPTYHVLGANFVLETQLFRAKFRLMYKLDTGSDFEIKLR